MFIVKQIGEYITTIFLIFSRYFDVTLTQKFIRITAYYEQYRPIEKTERRLASFKS